MAGCRKTTEFAREGAWVLCPCLALICASSPSLAAMHQDAWKASGWLAWDASEVAYTQWLLDGRLLFMTDDGWCLVEDEALLAIGHDEALAEREQAAPRWQTKDSRWTVGFRIEEKGGDMRARLDICLRKKDERCNSLVLASGEGRLFPWSTLHVGMGVDALDIVAFAKKRRVVVGRENLLLLLTLDPKPPSVESWSAWEDVNTFAGVEKIEDLSSFLAHLNRTAYTADGNRYLYGRGGEVWLGTFDGSLPGMKLITIPGQVASLTWSPGRDRIAIRDAGQRLFIVDVTPPGPPLIVVDAEEIL
jgi:hypothetical protein